MRLPLRHCLIAQLGAILIVCCTCVLGCFGWVRYHQISGEMKIELHDELFARGSQVAVSLSMPLYNYDKQTVNSISVAMMQAKTVHSISIHENGKPEIIFTRAKTGEIARVSGQNNIYPKDVIYESFDVFAESIKIGHITISLSTDSLEKSLADVRWSVFLQIVILDLLILIILIVVMQVKVVSPIDKLVKVSSDLSSGRLDATIDTDYQSEFGILAHCLLNMRNSVKATIGDLEVLNHESGQLKNYLSKVIDFMPSMLVGVDFNGVVTQWNLLAETMTGISKREALGRRIHDISSDVLISIEKIMKAIHDGETYSEQNVPVSVDLGNKYYDIVVYPVHDGDSAGAVIRIDDVTSRAHMKNMMIQAEKMTSLGGMAAGMAHEINNPLAGIIQGLQIAFMRIDADKKENCDEAEKLGIDICAMNEYLERRKVLMFLNGASDAANKAANVVRNMLSFSRKSDTELVPTDLINLLEETILLGASDYDMKKRFNFKFVDIKRDYSEAIPPVLCCYSEIEQVLLNIFKNAVQAMEEVNELDYSPELYLRVFSGDEFVSVEVTDNGPGMSDSVKERIFEPFFTTKPVGAGTGLGLSVSYMIVTQNHDGIFDVESEVGKGTKFSIKLPVSVRTGLKKP